MAATVDYKECLVPDLHLHRRVYVWVAYSTKPPYLPVAVDDTAEQLAALVGRAPCTISASWKRLLLGKTKRSRYHRVKVGYDLSEEAAP